MNNTAKQAQPNFRYVTFKAGKGYGPVRGSLQKALKDAQDKRRSTPTRDIQLFRIMPDGFLEALSV